MSFLKKIRALRGAVCCSNTASSIEEQTVLLYQTILDKNKISEADIVFLHFTVTADITALNPATALRKNGFVQNTALFCSAEPPFANSLPFTVRVLMLYHGRKKPLYVYINGAEILR